MRLFYVHIVNPIVIKREGDPLFDHHSHGERRARRQQPCRSPRTGLNRLKAPYRQRAVQTNIKTHLYKH